ncbi:STAS domain-containing protein [Bacillus sp. V5-8f]|uniref:STAS domain-containing protein n=1 Tax=Bacillus sp. V5-8f TaxID=2053044 RepID=UPI000C75A3F2|nr:STAS domain-containing protein [Bacillus sp. V5-8f]PLT35454.1 anti-anti-sigma factor [Bacillus sp. V5-8f]
MKMYVEFIGFLGTAFSEDKEGVPAELLKWSKENGERIAAAGEKISNEVVRYPPTREVFTDILTKIGTELKLSLEENSFLIKRVNSLLDISLNEAVFAFERRTEKMLEENKMEMAKLSAPIVPIREGIAVLPLIGSIDHYRAQYIMDNVVPKIANLQLDYLIADFSGILDIDEEVAFYLNQISSVLNLLGVKVIITGLRPELVKTVVKATINVSSIATFGHLKQALDSLE